MDLNNAQSTFLRSLNMHAHVNTFSAWVTPECRLEGYRVNLREGTLSADGTLVQLEGVQVYQDGGEWFVRHTFRVQGRTRRTVHAMSSAREAFAQARAWIRRCESHGTAFLPVAA